MSTMNELNLKVLFWNVNLKYDINMPMWVLSEILKLNPDIIILAEFYKVPNYGDFVQSLTDEGYLCFEDKSQRTYNIRQIFIAVKKSIVVESQDIDCIILDPNHLFWEQGNDDDTKNYNLTHKPNFLSVPIKIKSNNSDNEISLRIIGTRIRNYGAKKNNRKVDWENERKFRNVQLENLMNKIQEYKDENILIAGDFNIDNHYEKTNWHYKNDFESVFKEFNIYVPEGEKGSVLNPKYQEYKLDKFIVSSPLEFKEIKYLFNFPQINAKNYPDHAILFGELTFKNFKKFSIFDMLFTSGGETYTKDELLERGITEKLLEEAIQHNFISEVSDGKFTR